MLQNQDDWNRYEMERDEAIERRREALTQAWKLNRAGRKLAQFFPDVGNINLQISAQYRAEARQIKREWK